MATKRAGKRSRPELAPSKSAPARLASSRGVVPAGAPTFRVIDGFPVDTTGRQVLPTPLKSKAGARRIAKAVKAVVGS